MKDLITIHRIPMFDIPVYSPAGDCIGSVQNLLEILDLQLQIAKYELEGYSLYFINEGQLIKGVISKNGLLDNHPGFMLISNLEIQALDVLARGGKNHINFEEILKQFSKSYIQ